MDTSHGELEIELWCKEVPKGCRNFLQLCLDGYYDNCKFHRLFPNFMVQGGDPTGTGEGGKSCYGQPFQDEFNSRLSFITRGILAYSNEGPNTNESQFFITFDSCQWLDKKHTIFGRVVGNTIHNLMSMNSVDTDENDQPLQPIQINTIQVIIDPFNLVSHELPKPTIQEQPKPQKQQQKVTQKTKNTSLLSFGDEEDDYEPPIVKSIVNCHDVLDDPKLKKESAKIQEEVQDKKKQVVTQQIQTKKDELQAIPEDDRKLLLNYKITKNEKGQVQYQFDEKESESEASESIEDEEQRQIRDEQLEQYEKLRADVLMFKENKFGSNNPMIRDRLEHEKKLLSTVEQRRARFLQDMKEKSHEQAYDDKIKSLLAFKQSDTVTKDKYHWLNHKLKFHVDSANAFGVVEAKQKVQDYHSSELITEETYKSNPQKRDGKAIEKLLKLSE